jgi:hypothetical protein
MFLTGAVSVTVNGKPYQSNFIVTRAGSESSGLNLNKLWAFDMVEIFADEKNFRAWVDKREYLLKNPTAEFGSLSGTILNNAATYRKMVEISLENQVVTGATALLALEPGMELLDEDRFSNEEGNGDVAVGIVRDAVKSDSLKDGLSAAPNPFNPSTTIYLKSRVLTQVVTLNIYGPDGRLVLTLTARPNNGRVQFQFKGCDSSGNRLASGIYLARAFSGNKTWQMKLMLMK